VQTGLRREDSFMFISTRVAIGISAGAFSLSLALAPAVFAQEAMQQDIDFKNSLSKFLMVINFRRRGRTGLVSYRLVQPHYQTEVESWRHLQSANIEFTMTRLREPIEGTTIA
jgi:hypothetical protein